MDKKFGWEIFNKAINLDEINCSPVDLYKFLAEELNFNTDEFDKTAKISISLLIPIVSNQWPDWGTFDINNETIKKQKFGEFIQYLIDRIKEILKEDGPLLPKHKDEDEFTLRIECPPRAVNTLICQSRGDDIVFKHHQEIPWRELTINELVNWPYVSVTFSNDDLMFTRSVCIDYQRYINYLRRNYASAQNVIIESAERISETRSVIPCNILETYMNEYLEALHLLKIPAKKETEILTILENFIDDIKHMNINPPLQTIATDTKILVRINTEYVRNKKLSRTDHNCRIYDPKEIGFCEIITPKIELLLSYFRAQFKEIRPISYGIVANCRNNQNINILPKIYYKCLFCNIEFIKEDAMDKLLYHLYHEHKMEHQVRCISCKQSFEIPRLSRHRWKHLCQKATSTT